MKEIFFFLVFKLESDPILFPMFKAIYIDQAEHEYSVALTELDNSTLPEDEVEVAVEYSTLNYKDALAITGKGPVVRSFSMVPGIDLAGRLTDSKDVRFAVGDRVLLTGWGMGELHWGGLAQCARGHADWFLPLPKPFSTFEAEWDITQQKDMITKIGLSEVIEQAYALLAGRVRGRIVVDINA
ncbi:alcohol dehydrogenase catalytic domain-containing protein [Nitrospira sp. M1]